MNVEKFTSRRYAVAALLLFLPFCIGGLIGIPRLFLRICKQIFWPTRKNGWLIFREGKALDNLCNTMWWFHGHPQETISSHAGRMYAAGSRRWQVLFLKWLLETAFKDQNHLQNAVEEPFRERPLDV